MTSLDAVPAFMREWQRQRLRRVGVFSLAFALMLAAILLSLALGVMSFAPPTIVRVLAASLLPGSAADIPAAQRDIVLNLRLPRTLMALIAGAGLSMAGAAMQGITRNVLVSPFTVGISPAAAFGASLAILLGFNAVPVAGPYLIVAYAFVSAFACACLVLALSALRGVGSTMLILCGVGLTYLFGALTATVQFVASEQQLAAIVHWTFGSLNGTTWTEVTIAGSVFVAMAPLLVAHGAALNAFAAGGDEVAASLGFAVIRIRLVVTLATVLITAAIVSFVGVIGFVGLVGPHIARLLIGGDNKALLPFAAISGAILVLAADLVGRLAFAPVVVPVGIVIAYIGVPIFLQLLLTRRREWAE